MKKPTVVRCVFLDVGGVLLTDGWDHHARKRAAKRFALEWAALEARYRAARLQQLGLRHEEALTPRST